MKSYKQLLSEFIGSAGLLIVVVGSGIMGEALAQGNSAIALLANALATGAGLYALIHTFGPISGAHFNPAVSLVELLSKRLSAGEFFRYLIAQVTGAVTGVIVCHVMFGMPLLQLSTRDRGEGRLVFSEVVATFGLLMVIALSGKRDPKATPLAVALFITSAYWCTASTSFANPAVTIARSLTDTFSGILWSDVPLFIGAQIVGALAAFGVSRRLSS